MFDNIHLVGPQDLTPCGGYLHCSTNFLASSLVLIIGASIPTPPASRALEMRAVELSQTRMMGNTEGNFSSLWTHSNAVLSSRRPCCWSINTAPKPRAPYCSVTTIGENWNWPLHTILSSSMLGHVHWFELDSDSHLILIMFHALTSMMDIWTISCK